MYEVKQKMKRISRVALPFSFGIFLSLIASGYLSAATITTELDGGLWGLPVISISGEIVDGDYSRFLRAASEVLATLQKTDTTEWNSSGVLVRIDSPGGNVIEAIEIARAIRQMRFATQVGATEYFESPTTKIGDPV